MYSTVHRYIYIYTYNSLYTVYVGISQKGWVSFFFVEGGVLDLMMDGWLVVLWMGLMEFFEGVDGWERGFGGMGWGGGDGWGWKLKGRCG